MPTDIQSIDDLMDKKETDDDASVSGQFQKRQAEIKLKEMETIAQNTSASLGVPYVDLSFFPVGPEALGLIEEEEARRLNVICFYF